MRTPLVALVTRFAARLRFPTLFAVTAALFVLDLLIPDFIPFADEVLLALATLLLGTWKRQRDEDVESGASERPGADRADDRGRARSI